MSIIRAGTASSFTVLVHWLFELQLFLYRIISSMTASVKGPCNCRKFNTVVPVIVDQLPKKKKGCARNFLSSHAFFSPEHALNSKGECICIRDYSYHEVGGAILQARSQGRRYPRGHPRRPWRPLQAHPPGCRRVGSCLRARGTRVRVTWRELCSKPSGECPSTASALRA